MKAIGIVAVRRDTASFLKQQLDNLFAGLVKVNPYILSEIDGKTQIHEESLLVFAGRDSFYMADEKLEASCERIIASRSVSYDTLNDIFRIPEGSTVYLLNDFYSSALETIAYLKELGITHIKYEPLHPGAKADPQIKTVVTVGEHDLMPPSAEEIIDIGIRTIGISTIVEILLRLDLPQETIERFSTRYIEDIVSLLGEVHQLNNRNGRTRNQLETIITNVDEAIISIDKDWYISVFNNAAEKIFGIKREQIVGKHVRQVLREESEKFLFLHADAGSKNEIFQFDDKKILVNVSALQEPGGTFETLYVVKEITEIQELEQKIRMKIAPKRYVAQYSLDDIVGVSEAINERKKMVRKISRFDSPAYIYGESGTGKELFAQAIHLCSARRNGPFVAVNFPAISESLLESELFGYAEGAFTGAKKGGKPGLFEQAHGGTLFLDEIGDSPLEFQIRLLRVLQEKQVRRLGDDKVIPVDVRIIVATNKDIRELVSEGKFREDLYYRIHVLPIDIPPLRERREDILPLAQRFWFDLAEDMGKKLDFDNFINDVKLTLTSYDFPGNVRQLRNVIEYLICVTDGGTAQQKDLPPELRETHEQSDRTQKIDVTSAQALKKKCLQKILERSEAGLQSGRRTLSKELMVSEDKIKKTIKSLEEEGFVITLCGRKGIQITKKGIETVKKG